MKRWSQTGDEPPLRGHPLDADLLAKIVHEMMSGAAQIRLQRDAVPVRRTSAQRLKTVTFTMVGREYTAIEQNPDKPSRWGQLAKAGHHVVQFKDVETNRFVAVAVDGKVKEYGGMKRPRTSPPDTQH